MRLAGRLLLGVALFVLWLTDPASAVGQDGPERIRLNQVGFYPDAPKAAVVVDAPTTVFYITTPDLADTVFTGTLSGEKLWSPAQERVRLADFTELTQPGTYVVVVPDLGKSHWFDIANGVHHEVARGAIKAYYYQRASTALRPQYADLWARSAGHPDDEVLIHASAATDARPEGTVISAPKGWYDAGDYNKYIVNSGISTGTLLMLYEHYPAFFDGLDTNIPESGDGVPDLLDEILWNLRWMMAMQDPHDGGVYHKLTTPNFEGAVMPSRANQQRYVVQKSTSAALDFAAVAAIGARVFDDFDAALPGLADSLLTAAQNAWVWAQFNPFEPYSQNQINQAFEPNINTGEYGDQNFFDEFRWAAAELYVTTRQDSFPVMYNPLGGGNLSVPGWPNVGTMGIYSLVHHRADLTGIIDTAAVNEALLRLANQLVESRRNNPYDMVMGSSSGDFYWGSNSGAANQGMALLQAYQLTGEDRYLHAALSNLDYLLGRNGTGYSFVTGYGDKPPRNPHHRQSEADTVVDPVPGMLAGGPNPGQQDNCTYPSNLPAKSYVDDWCSYASNEIAINWNAPLAYLAGAMEAIMSPTGRPVAIEDGAGEPVPSAFMMESYPNPAQGRTHVRFALDRPTDVTLVVYDVLGREVGRVLERTALSAGVHEHAFDTRVLPAGLYLLRLQTAQAAFTKPLIVIH